MRLGFFKTFSFTAIKKSNCFISEITDLEQLYCLKIIVRIGYSSFLP